jgi:hypothetical protein
MSKVIIVAGPGRCGTSAVAGKLSDLGVFMGGYNEQDDANPQGYFEDADFKRLHKLCLAGDLNLYDWYQETSQLVSERTKQHELWGFKDPRVCYFLQHYQTMIQDPFIIRVRRVRQEVVGSMMKWYGWTYQVAYKTLMEREMLLDGVKTHDFFIQKQSLEELEKWLNH